MKKNIVGREREILSLQEAVASPNAELIAVYGRRRIGKTFLIKEFFNNKFTFYATGQFEGKKIDEITAFCQGFPEDFRNLRPPVSDWMDAFIALRDFLKMKRGKKIVFLDELPWFDVPPSHFLKAFEWFWNSWGSTQPNLKLIVCGSATSWMKNKFISSKGGLYNRTTRQIYLGPFKLRETKLLFSHNKIRLRDLDVLESYMVFGGVPYYINMIKKEQSVNENINRLFFTDKAVLKNEYDFLLKSLFKEDNLYKKIIDALAKKNKGLTRKEILEVSKLPDNGRLSDALKTLEDCDFIREYQAFGKTSRDSVFQLIDPFILFYKRFVERYKGHDENFWINNIQSPRRHTWLGLAFELVCLIHLNQIKEGLGINGISTWAGGWVLKGTDKTEGAQIDLLIDRKDNIINICEMKFSNRMFEITKALEKEVMRREDIFLHNTRSRKTISNILVTPWGEKPGKYSGLFDKVITLDAFFK